MEKRMPEGEDALYSQTHIVLGRSESDILDIIKNNWNERKKTIMSLGIKTPFCSFDKTREVYSNVLSVQNIQFSMLQCKHPSMYQGYL